MAAASAAPPVTKADLQEELVSKLIREFREAEGKRGVWNSHWEEVAKYVLPHYSNSFFPNQMQTPGVKRGFEMFDVTANGALWKFAAAMESMLTPANSRWQRYRPVDPELMKDREAALWYDHLTDAAFHYRYSPHSGFQSNQHDAYVSIGGFGTSCIFTDEFNDPTQPKVKGLRYRNVPLGELYFAANHQGQIDKVFRKFKMTLRQIAQKWGVEALPAEDQGKLRDKPEFETWIIHVVRPNESFQYGRLDDKGKRFSSHYVMLDRKKLLHEGGYRTQPYSVARYLTAPGELYGRGPAMNVLPSIKLLNEEKKVLLKQGQRAVDPVLLAHDDGILEGFTMKSGHLNPGGVSAEGRPLVHALPTGNMQLGKELMDDERLTINDAFLVTLFQILVETPQMTATEVLERAREKGALLSPTMGRYQSEGLGPMCERELDLLMWQGLVPPPPPSVVEAGAQYKVEYDAPLNRAMRSEEAAGIMRSVQWAGEIVSLTQDPSPMDWFDWDAIVPSIADINGAPFKYIKDPTLVAQIREARKADQAAAQVTQALPGMAAMMKAASPQGTNANPGQPG